MTHRLMVTFAAATLLAFSVKRVGDLYRWRAAALPRAPQQRRPGDVQIINTREVPARAGGHLPRELREQRLGPRANTAQVPMTVELDLQGAVGALVSPDHLGLQHRAHAARGCATHCEATIAPWSRSSAVGGD